MSETNDSAIIEGRELQLELGGKTYVWREPVRRVLRKMLRGLIAIDKLRDGRSINDPEYLLDLVDAALDFFYAHHEGMSRDRASLDNCDEDEVAKALEAVAAFLQLPLERMRKRVEAAQSMRTQNPESTNS